MRSMPAVHTIPQKLDRVSVTKSARRWPAVHTIPQKQMREQKARELALSLLSTLSPKNSNTSPTCKINTLACCPHYPPKTFFVCGGLCGAVVPAVHTIPQKPLPFPITAKKKLACCPHYPPKTSRWARTFASNKTACCPHYPPKTQQTYTCPPNP